MPNQDPKLSAHKKAASVGLAVVLIFAVSGYFMGLRQTAHTAASRDLSQIAQSSTGAKLTPEVPIAKSYREMGNLPKPNTSWSNILAKLQSKVTNDFTTLEVSPEKRAEAITQRTARRAYDGAPPVIPHPIEQISAVNCMACHGEGKLIKDRVASKMSHVFMSNCTQCHVPAGFGTPVENHFHGAATLAKAERAYEGAPPTIPHPTLMRADCMSCHGPTGSHGLRTTHPWRQSCAQCHAQSADLDQRGFESTTLNETDVVREIINSLASTNGTYK